MKHSILSVCLLVCSILFSMNATAERRPVKPVSNPRLQLSQSQSQELPARHTHKVVMSDDTVKLAESYNIDDVEAFYYQSGGHAYYSLSIWNYDDEFPHLRLEFETTSKTKIQGKHSIELTFSYLTLDGVENLTLSKALCWMKFTGLDTYGDQLYDIVAIVNASDGKVYEYRANMPIYAYDEYDNYEPIELEDEIDDSVVDPTKTVIPTAIDQITNDQSPMTNKIIKDNQLFILRGDKTYTITGAEVK